MELQNCMTYIIAVCTVGKILMMAVELSEICRFSFQEQIWDISASSWFYYKDIRKCFWLYRSHCQLVIFGTWMNGNLSMSEVSAIIRKVFTVTANVNSPQINGRRWTQEFAIKRRIWRNNDIFLVVQLCEDGFRIRCLRDSSALHHQASM